MRDLFIQSVNLYGDQPFLGKIIVAPEKDLEDKDIETRTLSTFTYKQVF